MKEMKLNKSIKRISIKTHRVKYMGIGIYASQFQE